jgi:Tfp pilus assembly protein PilX
LSLDRELLFPALMRKRDPEKGAALVLTMITIAALLGLGAVTLLTMQAELVSSGQTRFQAQALYAAESGVAAGIDYLRNSCSPTEMFSASISPGNAAPPTPPADQLLGNGIKPGETGSLFGASSQLWYDVSILNNINDTGLADGIDSDGVVILRSTGHGPDNATVALEVEVVGADCIGKFCAQEFAQRNITARNDANAICSKRVESTATTRTLSPGATP